MCVCARARMSITNRNEPNVTSSQEVAMHGIRRSQKVFHIFALNRGLIFVVFNFASASRGIVIMTKENQGRFSNLNINKRFQTLRGKEWTTVHALDTKMEAVSE